MGLRDAGAVRALMKWALVTPEATLRSQQRLELTFRRTPACD